MYLPCSRTLNFTDVGIQIFIYFSILRFFQWQGKAIHSPFLLLAFSSSHYKSIPSNQFDLASGPGCRRWTWSFNLGPTLMHMVKVWRIKIITQLLCEMCQVHLFSNTVWIILFCSTGSLKNSNKDSKAKSMRPHSMCPYTVESSDQILMFE